MRLMVFIGDRLSRIAWAISLVALFQISISSWRRSSSSIRPLSYWPWILAAMVS